MVSVDGALGLIIEIAWCGDFSLTRTVSFLRLSRWSTRGRSWHWTEGGQGHFPTPASAAMTRSRSVSWLH